MAKGGSQELLRGSPWQRLYFLPDPQWHGELRDCSLPLAWPGLPPSPTAVRDIGPVDWCTPALPSTVGALYCRLAGRSGRPNASGSAPPDVGVGPVDAGVPPCLSTSSDCSRTNAAGAC